MRPVPRPSSRTWTILDASRARLFYLDPERHPEEFASNNVIRRDAALAGQWRRFRLVELFYPASTPDGAIYYVFGFGRAGKLRQFVRDSSKTERDRGKR